MALPENFWDILFSLVLANKRGALDNTLLWHNSSPDPGVTDLTRIRTKGLPGASSLVLYNHSL